MKRKEIHILKQLRLKIYVATLKVYNNILYIVYRYNTQVKNIFFFFEYTKKRKKDILTSIDDNDKRKNSFSFIVYMMEKHLHITVDM